MKPNKLLVAVICLFVSATLLTTTIFADINSQMEGFVKKREFTKAEKYCDRQKDDQRNEYYKILADICFNYQYYDNAAKYYEIAGNQDGLKKVAAYFYENEQYDNAGKYYGLIGNKAELENSYTKLADSYFGMRDKTFSGQNGSIYSVVISADSRYIAMGGSDQTIKLWDLASGKELKTFSGHNGSVVSIAISADDRYIVSGCLGGSNIILWDLASGEKLRTFSGYNVDIDSIAISADNRYIVTDGYNVDIWQQGYYDNTIILWDLASGKKLKTFFMFRQKNDASLIWLPIAISADNRYIISGSADQTIKLWELASGKELKTFPRHNGSVVSVAVSADDHYIAAVIDDQTIKFWDLTSGIELKNFSGLNWPISSVAISKDNCYIATVSSDQNVVQCFTINNDHEYEKAAEYYEKAGNKEGLRKIADAAFSKMYYDKAVEYYEKAGNKEGLRKVADACLNAGNFGTAMDLYLKLGDNENAIYNKAADAAFSKTDYDKAAEFYEKASNKEGLRKVADACLNAGNFGTAMDLYLKLGDNENAIYNKAADAAFSKTDYDKAAEFYEKASNKEGLRKVADACLNTGNFGSAIDLYLKLGDNENAIYNKAADAAFLKADYDKAVEYYEKTGNQERLRKVADACLNTGSFGTAIDLYLKLGDNENAIYNKAADAAFSKTDYDKAAEYYEKASNKEGLRLIEAINNLTGSSDTSIRIQAIRILEGAGGKRAVPILVQSLPDWEIGPYVAGVLRKFGWQPKTFADKVHFWVALRNSDDLKNIWPQTKQVLLNDVISSNKLALENALYAFIGIGRREIISDLINTLNENGTKTIAEAYLNCGSQELYDAGEKWCTANGYIIYTVPGSASIRWGSM